MTRRELLLGAMVAPFLDALRRALPAPPPRHLLTSPTKTYDMGPPAGHLLRCINLSINYKADHDVSFLLLDGEVEIGNGVLPAGERCLIIPIDKILSREARLVVGAPLKFTDAAVWFEGPQKDFKMFEWDLQLPPDRFRGERA